MRAASPGRTNSQILYLFSQVFSPVKLNSPLFSPEKGGKVRDETGQSILQLKVHSDGQHPEIPSTALSSNPVFRLLCRKKMPNPTTQL